MGLGAELVGQLDHLGDWGVLATDARLAVTGWNRWLVQHTGRAAATVLGRPLFDLFPDLDRPARRSVLPPGPGRPPGRPLPAAAPVRPAHAPGIAGTGLAHMQQSVRIVPIVDGPGAGGTLTLIEDVTERVTHEAELRARARRQAAIAAAARAALAGREMEDVARDVVGRVRETLGVEFAEVLERSPAGRPGSSWPGPGWSRPAAAVFEAAAARRAGRSGRPADGPVEADDAAADPRLAADAHLRATGWRAAWSGPRPRPRRAARSASSGRTPGPPAVLRRRDRVPPGPGRRPRDGRRAEAAGGRAPAPGPGPGRRRPAEGRVPGDAGPRAAQPPGPDPQRRADPAASAGDGRRSPPRRAT